MSARIRRSPDRGTRSSRSHRTAFFFVAAALGLACAGEVSRPSAEQAPPRGEAAQTPIIEALFEEPVVGVVPQRLLLISVSGLRPSHYGDGPAGLETLSADMPNLARLAANGAFSDGATTVVPAAPYPVHATLVTGLYPFQHGLLGDEPLGPHGLTVMGLADAGRIKGLTLWRAAAARGVAVTALDWPSTLGASIALVLPDLGVPQPETRWYDALEPVTTPWIYDRLRRLRPALAEVRWPSASERDSLVSDLACEIAGQPTTPGLWLLSYQQGAETLAIRGPQTVASREAFARVDEELGRLFACLARNKLLAAATVLVTGDRALMPVHTVVYPNGALEAAGLITKAPARVEFEISRWQAIVRSYGGSAAVYAVDEPSALLARRALEEQAARTRAFRVVPAAELVALSADPQAWFGLEATPGYVLANPVQGTGLSATPIRGQGGYLPSQADSGVGFVAWGAGVRSGVRLPAMSLLDVAPTAAALLGIPFPQAEGNRLVGILRQTGPVKPPAVGSGGPASPRAEP